MWCKVCEEIVEPREDDGSFYYPKCKAFLKGCLVVNMKQWKYKRAEERFMKLSDHLDK